MSTQASLAEQHVFVVNSNFLLLLALSKDQMLFLDPKIHGLWMFQNFSALPSITIDVHVSLEPASSATGTQGDQLFTKTHSFAIVGQRTAIFKLFIELGHIPGFRTVICQRRPIYVCLDRRHASCSGLASQSFLQNLGLSF